MGENVSDVYIYVLVRPRSGVLALLGLAPDSLLPTYDMYSINVRHTSEFFDMARLLVNPNEAKTHFCAE